MIPVFNIYHESLKLLKLCNLFSGENDKLLGFCH